MEDFMDNLVREVEGNIRPVRTERLEEYPVESRPLQREEMWDEDEHVPERISVFREASGISRSSTVYVEAEEEPRPVYYDVPENPRQPRPTFPQQRIGNGNYPPYGAQAPYGASATYRVMPSAQPVPMPQTAPPPQSAPTQEAKPAASAEPEKTAADSAKENTSALSNDGAEKLERDLFLHIHRENVKCYRNTQATIIENTNMVKQAAEENQNSTHNWLLALLVLSLINLGANALIILHMVFGFL